MTHEHSLRRAPGLTGRVGVRVRVSSAPPADGAVDLEDRVGGRFACPRARLVVLPARPISGADAADRWSHGLPTVVRPSGGPTASATPPPERRGAPGRTGQADESVMASGGARLLRRSGVPRRRHLAAGGGSSGRQQAGRAQALQPLPGQVPPLARGRHRTDRTSRGRPPTRQDAAGPERCRMSPTRATGVALVRRWRAASAPPSGCLWGVSHIGDKCRRSATPPGE